MSKPVATRRYVRLLPLIVGIATLALGNVASAQTISTFAGGGTVSGDGVPATDAILNTPVGIAIDAAGNVYVADAGSFVVRRIDGATGVITTAAGNGVFRECIGDGYWGLCGNGGPATSANLSTPFGVAVDPAGNLYIADMLNSVIRKVDVATGIITVAAGGAFPGVGFDGDGGPALGAVLFYPQGVAVDAAGNIYIADTSNLRVRKVDGATGIINTIAGSHGATVANGGSGGDGGPGRLASFESVLRVALDFAGNVYVLDVHGDERGNHARVRRIDATTGIITTVAGGGTGTGESGPATEADLVGNSIADIALDTAGNLYIAGELQVWRVDAAGTISVFAGTGTPGFSGDGGPAIAAQFGVLGGIAVAGNGDVYISDSFSPGRVRRVTAAVVVPPPDVIIDDTTPQSVLDGLTSVPGNVVVNNTGRTTLDLGNLTSAGGVIVTNNPLLTTVDVSGLTTAGTVNISGNTSATTFNVSGLQNVAGDLTITDNDAATVVNVSIGGDIGGTLIITDNDLAAAVNVSIGGDIGGTVTITDNGDAEISVDTPRVDGNVDITAGGTSVRATTGGGTTRVSLANSPATMTVVLPAGSFTSSVRFSIQSLGAQPPSEGLDAGGSPVVVSPIAAYQFAFDIPTLNLDATLTFDIDVAALGAAGAAEFLEALSSNSATLGVRGDAPDSVFQTFAVCVAGQLPAAGGCVAIERFDATGAPLPAGDPTIPATVRFTGITGHFSTFAVVIVSPIDTTPPVISGVPDDIVAEATSPAGAVVDYAMPTAVDDRDGPVGVFCAPGFVFPLGATSVTCTATDLAGNTASATFSITVVDTIPPALHVPGAIVTNATSPGGAVVTFDASATDVSGPSTVLCQPASGSVFPAGTTPVRCTVVDGSGNTTLGEFHVTVRGAAEQIVDLIERLRPMPLGLVVKQRLLQSLNEALAQPRRTAVMCQALRIFAGFVQLQQGRSIPPALASELLADVTRIRAVLACG